MTSSILAALILGVFAGMAPGPYTTMVVGTALEKGFRRAVPLAMTPLVTDLLPMVLTAFLLERVSWTVLTVIGVLGGAIVIVVGFRFLRRHVGVPRDAAKKAEGQSAPFGHVVMSTILSPAPWMFWLVVGSPLMLRGWNRSWVEGMVFVVVYLATNVGTASGLAWGVSHSRRLLAPIWQRRALQAVGTGLVLAGLLLVWQSLEGNFQAMVDQQNAVRSAVEETTS